MHAKHGSHPKGLLHELAVIFRRARQVWRLVPRRHKWGFGGALALMAFSGACNTALPLFLGKLVDAVQHGTEHGVGAAALYRLAAFYLALIAGSYFLRETIGVARRYLVENACTRMDKVLTVRLVSHLMRVDLATLTQEKVGALHGRISRSVVGFVRFLRLVSSTSSRPSSPGSSPSSPR
jgi:ATP-binding cassette subfamily B protein